MNKSILIYISIICIALSVIFLAISNYINRKNNNKILEYQQQINSKLDSLNQMKNSIDSMNNNPQQYQFDDIEIK